MRMEDRRRGGSWLALLLGALLGCGDGGLHKEIAPKNESSGKEEPRLEIEDVSPAVGNFPVTTNHSVSGKVLSMTVSKDGTRVFAGTYSGVWRSDDSGASWRQLTRPQPPNDSNLVSGALEVPTVIDLVVSPVDNDLVLAVTGYDVRAISRDGIYRSVDGGESWQLVHQFTCPTLNVGQIVFAPDDPKLLYATGGCAVAVSEDSGQTWVDRKIPSNGEVWHVSVAPKEESFAGHVIRRVYGAGTNQVWFSENGGETWIKDQGAVPMSEFEASTGAYPVGGRGNASPILAVEPGNSTQVFLVTNTISNGPAYFRGGSTPDGTSCLTVGCGGASVFVGDFSNFPQSQVATWTRLPDPPDYNNGDSGRNYLITKVTDSGYLLFLGNKASVNVSQGRPTESASWHRLDGRDVSQSRRVQANPTNLQFMHFDPMSIAVSSDFDISLKRVTDLPFPYNQNSELDTGQPIAGAIWLANDGGIYRSTDGGQTWVLTSGLSNLQPASTFAALALSGKPPAFYFGVPDDDDFFTVNGGATWGDPVTSCGDCESWSSDPLQTDRVLQFAGRNKPPGFNVYVSVQPGVLYPNANVITFSFPYPGRCADGSEPLASRPCTAKNPYIFEFTEESPEEAGFPINKLGYRPIVLTLAGETPEPDGDYLVIRLKPNNERVLLRTTHPNLIKTPFDWNTTATEDGPGVKAFQQGPTFPPEMQNAIVVQASGGHTSTVFYVGDPTSTRGLWKWTGGDTTWQQIVPAANGSAQEAQIFYADPYNPNRIYIVDVDGVKRTEDGGKTWLLDRSLDALVTDNDAYDFTFRSVTVWVGEVILLSDMVFDPVERGTRFATGPAGVFFTLDGDTWNRLLSTKALPSYPVSAFFNRISDPERRSLDVAFNGRSLLQLGPIAFPTDGACH